MTSFSSPYWDYFKIIPEDQSTAECKLCGVAISRGGKTAKTYTTSGLSNHLKSKHKEEFSKCEEKTQKRKLPPTSGEDESERQPPAIAKQVRTSSVTKSTLQQCIEKTVQWDINHPKAKIIHYAISWQPAISCSGKHGLQTCSKTPGTTVQSA